MMMLIGVKSGENVMIEGLVWEEFEEEWCTLRNDELGIWEMELEIQVRRICVWLLGRAMVSCRTPYCVELKEKTG